MLPRKRRLSGEEKTHFSPISVQRRFSPFGGGGLAASIIRLTAHGQPNEPGLWIELASRIASAPFNSRANIVRSTPDVNRVLLLAG